MTASPEERAKAVCARITSMVDWRDREALIAQAIREAENDKLEEAAAHFERYSAAFSGRSFAATLRALKSKDTP